MRSPAAGASDLTERALDLLSDPYLALDTLAAIAHGKADHVASNWQDDALAAHWSRVAKKLDAQSLAIRKLGNPYHGGGR